MGDLNVNWSDKSGRKNLNITDYFNLTQLIEQPTRITNRSETKIDLLFTNRPEIIIKTFNLMTGLSDHNIILFARKLKKRWHVISPTLHWSDLSMFRKIPIGPTAHCSDLTLTLTITLALQNGY